MNVLGGVSIGFLGYTMFVVLDTIIKNTWLTTIPFFK